MKSWGAGRNAAPQGVLAELHILAERQADAAEAIFDAWEESGEPGEIEVALPDNAEIIRRGWPSRGAFMAIVARAWEAIGPDVIVRVVPAGSTAATKEAARIRKIIEP